MNVFLDPLQELSEYDTIEKSLQKQGLLSLTGCIDAAKAHLLIGLSRKKKYRLVVTYSQQRAEQLWEECKNFEPDAAYYPAKDVLFYQSDIRGNLLTAERMKALLSIGELTSVTVITTFDALMDTMMPPQMLFDQVQMLSVGDEVDLDRLCEKLVQLGYEKEYQVSAAGQFCVRGGILDVFPLTEENPVRIELFGEEIDTIRTFDAAGQRSIENLPYLVIYPACELVCSPSMLKDGIARMQADADELQKQFRKENRTEEAYRIQEHARELSEQWQMQITAGMDAYLPYFLEERANLPEYFSPLDTVIFFDELSRCTECGRATEEEFSESMKMRLMHGDLLPGQMHNLFSCKEVLSALQRCPSVSLGMLDARPCGLVQKGTIDLQIVGVPSYENQFSLLLSDLKKYKRNHYRVLLLCASRTRAKRLADDLTREGVESFYSEDFDRSLLRGQIMVTCGSMKRGFAYPSLQFAVITEEDIFGGKKKEKHRRKASFDGEKIAGLFELSVGDYVVHENHGVGIYRGLEKIEIDGIARDYIKISYADNANLYILATQLDLIQKYAGTEGKTPKINRLGGGEWKKTKTRVRGALEEVAEDLLKLYAAREREKGFAYSPDTVWQTEFEELFPYEETADQIAAIDAVKADMESGKVMDRLICGDVGFGKTEVALRAAFKAVTDSKQVAYLAPTTILAQQIYDTFCQRMKDYPIRVDLLCRFRTAAEQKKTIEDIATGRVDIIVGTHRILSDDVHFFDLGLLVIDEEQRFGVAHKEKIKKMKTNVDVLSLTATPIPRTLHMSLVGIRDMSLLQEPPLDRVPIQTYVMEYNEELVREAILRELARNGQVYYVYNRIRDIADAAARVQSMLPDASVAYAHGQMSEMQLSRIMYDFVNGDIDVLVSTTIIETGLDIPNVNTMIVCDADRMGLSQLYQLRGRVGRSGRTAYAFFMYRRDKILPEAAEKRLSAIREFTELGSGVRIAMRDLQIRGAGSLLGAQQSGHMEAVGYDLYCKMLQEAVGTAKGEELAPLFETTVDMAVDAFIPTSYIPGETQKLDMYKRIADLKDEEEADDILDEMIDRFGDPPQPAANLLSVARLKIEAHRAYVKDIVQKGSVVTLHMYEKAPIDVSRIPQILADFAPALRFYPDSADPRFTWDFTVQKGGKTDPLPALQSLFAALWPPPAA